MDDLQPGSSGWDLLHTVLGELALPMAVMDASRRLAHVSPALESLADTRFEPIPSDQVPAYFNLHDASGTRALDPAELTLVRACAGESVQDSYVTVKPKAGPVRLLRCTAAPLRDAPERSAEPCSSPPTRPTSSQSHHCHRSCVDNASTHCSTSCARR